MSFFVNRPHFLSMPVAFSLAYLFLAPPGVTPTLLPTEPPPGNVKVSIQVTSPERKQTPGKDALVWVAGMRSSRPGGVLPFKVASKDKRFEPRVSAVPIGSTVVFPNYDRIYHNVFSLSETAKFDLGLYRNGESRSFAFQNPGLVKIYCNIHPQMAAYLMVVPSSIYGQAGVDGIVRLDGLPPGRHPVHVWEERGGEWNGLVMVRPGETSDVAVVLDASTWRLSPHKNKYGKDYPPPDDEDNRY